MQISESITCPFCGQSFELAIDTSVPSQRFTTDCEICCPARMMRLKDSSDEAFQRHRFLLRGMLCDCAPQW